MSDKLQPISYQGFTKALMSLAGGNFDLDLKPLAGRKLAAVEVSEDKEELAFRFQDGGSVVYGTGADCCSHSWIEHVTVPPDIAGSEITAWGEQDSGEFEQDYETIRVYQTAFQTDKGEIIVEYRNSSNGYYGGWLSGPLRIQESEAGSDPQGAHRG